MVAFTMAALIPAVAVQAKSYMQESDGSIYVIDGSLVRMGEAPEGRRLSVPRFAWPSFESRSGGIVMAAFQTGNGVHLIKIDGASDQWTLVERVPGGEQPELAGGVLFFITSTGDTERLMAKRPGMPEEVIAEFGEIGGFEVVRRGSEYCVVLGATDGSKERLMVIRGGPGAWDAAVPITPPEKDRYWPTIASDATGRLLVACLGADAGRSYVCLLRERTDGGFDEQVLSVPGETVTAPSVQGSDRPLLFWIASGPDGRRLVVASVETPFDQHVVAASLGNVALTRIGARLYAGPGVSVSIPGLIPAELPPHVPALAVERVRDADAVLSFDRYAGYGDSIMEGDTGRNESPESAVFYPHWQAELTQRYGYAEVYNDGLGGENSDNGAERIDKIMADHAPGIVCIMEGTNDVTGRRGNYTSARTAGNLLTMAQKVRAIGGIPIVATIIPRSPIDAFDPRNKKTRQWNRAIREMTNLNFIPRVGMYRAFVRSRDWQTRLMKDDVHPSKEGYELMGEKWLDAIIANKPVVSPMR